MIRAYAADVAKWSPLGAAAWLLNFLAEYGAAVVTALSIIYGAMTVYLRALEIIDKRRKRKENADGGN